MQLSDKIHACTLATSFGGAFGSELIWEAEPLPSLPAAFAVESLTPGSRGSKSKEQSCATNDGRISLAELTETRRIIRLIRGQPVEKK